MDAKRRRWGPGAKGAAVGLGLSALATPLLLCWMHEGDEAARLLLLAGAATAGCAFSADLLASLRSLRPRWLRASLRGAIAGAAAAAGSLLVLGTLLQGAPGRLEIAVAAGALLAVAGWAGAAGGAALHLLGRVARGLRQGLRRPGHRAREAHAHDLPEAAPRQRRPASLAPAPATPPRSLPQRG